MLLDAGADANAHNNWSNRSTPLHGACKRGDLKTVNLLLKANANIHAVDFWGRTPAELACNRNYVDVAVRLLFAGADLFTHVAPRMPLDKADQLRIFNAGVQPDDRRSGMFEATAAIVRDFQASRDEAVAATDAIAEFLQPEVAAVVVHHRYIFPAVDLLQEVLKGRDGGEREGRTSREEDERSRGEEERNSA